MKEQEILNDIQFIFRRFFKNDDLLVSKTSSANNIKGWDSFSHMMLMYEVEKMFDIHLSLNEIIELQNIADLLALILKKQKP